MDQAISIMGMPGIAKLVDFNPASWEGGVWGADIAKLAMTNRLPALARTPPRCKCPRLLPRW